MQLIRQSASRTCAGLLLRKDVLANELPQVWKGKRPSARHDQALRCPTVFGKHPSTDSGEAGTSLRWSLPKKAVLIAAICACVHEQSAPAHWRGHSEFAVMETISAAFLITL